MDVKREEREAFAKAQKTLLEELKSGEFHPLYLLYGEERYLLSYYKKLFLKAFSENEGINITQIEENLETKNLIDTAETLPFFAPYRLMLFDGKIGGKKKLSDDFVQYLKTSPRTTVMLFLEEKVDKRSSFYKTVKDRGLILPCTVQDADFLERFAFQFFKKEKKQITRPLLQKLLERTGNNMYRIEAECQKVISFLGEEIAVTEEIEALGRGNRETLFRYYGDLLQLEESPTKIRSMIKNNVTKLLIVREMLTEGRAERDIAQALSMEPWRVRRFCSEARSYTLEALEDLVHALLRLEEEIRQGKIAEQMALEVLLCGEEKDYFS